MLVAREQVLPGRTLRFDLERYLMGLRPGQLGDVDVSMQHSLANKPGGHEAKAGSAPKSRVGQFATDVAVS